MNSNLCVLSERVGETPTTGEAPSKPAFAGSQDAAHRQAQRVTVY
jgi:hypothetical protein